MYKATDIEGTKNIIERREKQGLPPMPSIQLKEGCREVIVNDMVKDLSMVELEVQQMAYANVMEWLVDCPEAKTFEDNEESFDFFLGTLGYPNWAYDIEAFSTREKDEFEMTKSIVRIVKNAWNDYWYIRNLGRKES